MPIRLAHRLSICTPRCTWYSTESAVPLTDRTRAGTTIRPKPARNAGTVRTSDRRHDVEAEHQQRPHRHHGQHIGKGDAAPAGVHDPGQAGRGPEPDGVDSEHLAGEGEPV